MIVAIASQLRDLTTRVADFRAEFDAGRLVDACALESATANLCGRLEAAAKTEAQALLPGLIALLDDMIRLEQAVTERLTRLDGEFHETDNTAFVGTAGGRRPKP